MIRNVSAALLVVLLGCGRPPQVQSTNLRLIEKLQTAVSARQPRWLEQAADQIEQRHESHELPDAAYAAFQAILADGRAGRWAEAEAAVMALGKAQQPTAEEVERLKTPRRRGA